MKLKLPEINQRVGIVVGDGRLLSTRVEEVEAPHLLVAPPSDHGVTYLLSIGEQMHLEWTTERGLLRGTGRVVGRADGGGVPLVRIALDESSVIQRREFVRVDTTVEVDVRVHGEQYRASTLDLSGAGARVAVQGGLELDQNAVVTLVLYLPDSPSIEARGVVVRVDGDGVFAFHFIEIAQRDQERVVRYVFAAHRREFATVRRSA